MAKEKRKLSIIPFFVKWIVLSFLHGFLWPILSGSFPGVDGSNDHRKQISSNGILTLLGYNIHCPTTV